ncbi:hypothetical protein SAY86_021503 [Trapa natans]|uniref:PRA1 family protein n=1 Tax=Trapa natans TaxID=22666 RepID=A0AAN7RK71_TRANT|nr:hypothetical protein SAY86_021503 [Trapa natans]
MPCLNISTNVSLDGVDTSAILSEATSSVAKIIGKPEAYVMIVLKGSVPIAFGGTEQPAAFGELVSIGGLGGDVNKKLSAAIAAILETKLSVPKSRFFLKFYDTKASQLKFLLEIREVAHQTQEHAQCLHAIYSSHILSFLDSTQVLLYSSWFAGLLLWMEWVHILGSGQGENEARPSDPSSTTSPTPFAVASPIAIHGQSSPTAPPSPSRSPSPTPPSASARTSHTSASTISPWSPSSSASPSSRIRSPSFLFSGLLASWLFLYFLRLSDSPFVLLGRTYSDRETLGILIIFSIVLIFLTSVGSVLISAILAGVAVVCIHGSFRTPDWTSRTLPLPDSSPSSATLPQMQLLLPLLQSPPASEGFIP